MSRLLKIYIFFKPIKKNNTIKRGYTVYSKLGRRYKLLNMPQTISKAPSSVYTNHLALTFPNKKLLSSLINFSSADPVYLRRMLTIWEDGIPNIVTVSSFSDKNQEGYNFVFVWPQSLPPSLPSKNEHPLPRMALKIWRIEFWDVTVILHSPLDFM